MNERQKIFENVKNTAEEKYKKYGSVFCPFLDRKVNFNAKGLDHIKFKEWNKSRLISDQYLRLKFLKCVPLILQKSGTLQEFNERKVFERVKKNSRWEQIFKPVKYYGFISIIEFRIKVKVVIKEI